MGKKFKFKLEGLRSIRELKEKKVKNELGEILKEIEQTKAKIAQDQKDIEECYAAQESFLSEPATGQMVQFFPQYIQTKREDQKALGNVLTSLQRAYDEKIKELATAKGEVKVLDNLRDKQESEFDKLMKKKQQETLDEFTMIKRYRESKL
jgi:flagellar FliJ protein